jgi:hypothetical protein
MQELYTRALIALFVAGVLSYHARQTPAAGFRRRALTIGAIGALLIGGANLLQALTAGHPLVPALFVAGGIALLGGAALLYTAFRRGEFADQIARARAETAAERARRAADQSEQKQR